jgi:uncharacterized protein YbaR (Trm112 family)
MSDATHRQIQMGTAALPLSFVSALRCPLSAQRLVEVPAESLALLGFGGVRSEGWSGALLREDRRVVYPVRGGIPVLLGEERVAIAGEGGSFAAGEEAGS